MARRGSRLAERLREAHEREQSARSTEEKERLERLEAARVARAELFDDLVGFGGELGFVGVERSEDAVTLRRVERWLRFTAEGPGDEVVIDFTGRDPNAEHRLYREPALDHRWIWVRRRRGKEDRVPLFDQGLELLLVHALDLEAPGEAPPPVPPARTSPEESDSSDLPDGPMPQKRSL